MPTQRRSDRGSVVWWVVAVIGCTLVMLAGLTLVGRRAVSEAQAQAVADLAALAAVGADESAGATSPQAAAEAVSARNGWSLKSAAQQPIARQPAAQQPGALQSATPGDRLWRVRVGRGTVEASAAAEPDRVHPGSTGWP